jgi:hypothetical protein
MNCEFPMTIMAIESIGKAFLEHIKMNPEEEL